MSSEQSNYSPTYMWVGGRDGDGPSKVVHWDKMVVRHQGRTCFFDAWGDGAHCRQVGYLNTRGCLEKTDIAYHIGELEQFLKQAEYVNCELRGEISYTYGKAA